MPPIPPTLRAICLTTAAALALAGPAQARTIEPTTDADVRANDGLCSLREAITASNNRTPSGAVGGECPAGDGNDTIKLAATRYELKGAPADDSNVSGDLDILDSLTIVGAGRAATTIDARGVDRVIEIGPSPTGTLAVTIDAVTITGGQAPDGVSRPPSTGPADVTGDLGGPGAGGGGILNRATLTLRNSAVTGNKAGGGGLGTNATGANGGAPGRPGSAGTGGAGGPGGDGGGIRSDGKLLTVENSTIASNAAGGGGQAGYGIGGDGAQGSGSAGGERGGAGTGGRGGEGGHGGGIVASQRLKVIDSAVQGNAAGAGGRGNTGVAGFGGFGGTGSSPGGAGAVGTGGRGGTAGYGAGIAAEGDADVRRTLIAGNTGSVGGDGGDGLGGGGGNRIGTGPGGAGGLGVGGNGGLGGTGSGLVTAGLSTTENTTVSGNLTGDGGKGGAGSGGTGGTGPVLRGPGGDAIGGNGGDGAGGAGIAQAKGGTLSHVTIYENAVGGGAESGVVSPGTGQPAGRSHPGAKGSRGNLGAIWAFPGVTTSIRNSIVASNAGGNCTGTVTDGGRNVVFGDASCPGAQADPQLAGLQDNGGATATHAIPVGSPAQDAVPAAGADCPATDQRGVARPEGPACDSGAFEIGVTPTSSDGPQADGPTPDTQAPLFTAASLSAKVFKVDRSGKREVVVTARTKRGTTFRYSLSETARVTYTIERIKGRRRARVGRFAVASKVGANKHRFSGRIGRRALKPGRYRATLVATDAAGNKSKPRRLGFRVASR